MLGCRALAEGDKSRVGARETEREQTLKADHPDLIFIDNPVALELGLVITESLTRPAHCVFTLTKSGCSESPLYQAV